MDWIDEAIDILVESLCERLRNLRELVRITRENSSLTDITNLAHEIDRITRVLGRAEAQRNTDREDGHQAIRNENLEEVAPRRRGVVRRREEVEEDGAEQDMEGEYERFRKRIRRSLRKMR